MRMIMHIGLHKTGTTAFQLACSKSHEKLLENKILYPRDEALTLGTVGHVGLPNMLKAKDGVKKAIETIIRAAEANPRAGIMLVSSEDLSTFFGDEKFSDQVSEFSQWAGAYFDDQRYFCLIRDERKLISSTVLQLIESNGFPLDGKKLVNDCRRWLHIRSRRLDDVLGNKLTVMEYERFHRDNFCSRLILKMTGERIDLPEAVANSSAAKDGRILLSASIRSFCFNKLNAEHPYAQEVNKACNEILEKIEIDPEINDELIGGVYGWLNSILSEIISSPKDENVLKSIFNYRIT